MCVCVCDIGRGDKYGCLMCLVDVGELVTVYVLCVMWVNLTDCLLVCVHLIMFVQRQ